MVIIFTKDYFYLGDYAHILAHWIDSAYPMKLRLSLVDRKL